ncbi:MAG TPA: hypothetical protein VK687_02590 [Bryobacteraceae bacterium]|nr:hypothetical protein [Bryobacteraceae bacterium]
MTTGERDSQLELLQRTLDLLILQTLAFGPAHGHAIAIRRGAARVALPGGCDEEVRQRLPG